MATSVPVTERLDREIAAVAKMIAEVPEIDRDWDDLPESVLVGWLLDWDQAMGTLLGELARAKESHQMSAAQDMRYRELLATLRPVMPTIKRRSLCRPPVSLDP